MHQCRLGIALVASVDSAKHWVPKLYTFGVFPMTSRLNGECIWEKHAIGNRKRRWKLQRYSTVSQNFMDFGPQTAKSKFTIRKSCMLLLCQLSQREVIKQNSTKLHMLEVSHIYKHTSKFEGFHSLKIGGATITAWDGFQLDESVPDAEKYDRSFFIHPP